MIAENFERMRVGNLKMQKKVSKPPSVTLDSDARLKTPVFPVRNRFRARSSVGAWASDSNFNSGEAHGNLGNLLAIGEPVFYVQLDGILDVLDGFFVGVALAVAALERGAGNEKAIRVCLDDDGKSNVLHDFCHYRPLSNLNKIDFAGCREKRGWA